MMMARLSLLKCLPRLASMAPFLCLIVAQCEWPDMAVSFISPRTPLCPPFTKGDQGWSVGLTMALPGASTSPSLLCSDHRSCVVSLHHRILPLSDKPLALCP